MARRAAGSIDTIEPDLDPINEVIRNDRANVAEDLADALTNFQGYESGQVKGILYRTARGNGKFEWIKEVYSPFDHNEIFTDLQSRFGGGDFQLRMMVNGKIAKNINFSIVHDPKWGKETPRENNDNTMVIVQMMMAQSAESARESRAQADRQMQMMMQMGQQQVAMMSALLPAMMGAQTKIVDLMPLLTHDKGSDLKGTIEIMAGMKTLFAGGEEKSNAAFDPSDMVGSVARLAGPIAAGIGQAFRGRAGPPVTGQEIPIPPATFTDAPPPVFAPLAVEGQPDKALPAPSAVHPVIRLITPDILYFFSRRHDAGLAAEAILAIVERAQVTEEDLNAALAPLMVSQDLLADLAGFGIDLRADPQWADNFRAALIEQYMGSNVEGDDERPGGGGGGQADPGRDGAAGPSRVDADGGEE